jgi:hypothetical protein
MGDEDTGKTEKKSGGSMSAFTKLMATFGTALIMFFAGIVWRSYEKTNEMLETITKRIEKLEEDKSKWGTLTELHNKLATMDREVYRMQGIFDYAAAVEKGVPKPLSEMRPPTIELPKPPVTQLKPPSELFKDPDDYQRIQQQKFPPNTKK